MITQPHRKQKGFTLLEVLVSMGLFSVAAMALAQAFSYQLAFNTSNEVRSGAIMAAQQVLDDYRVQDPVSLPNSGSAGPFSVPVGSRTFNVTVFFCQGTTVCSTPTVRHLRADVVYKNTGVYSVETIYAQLR